MSFTKTSKFLELAPAHCELFGLSVDEREEDIEHDG